MSTGCNTIFAQKGISKMEQLLVRLLLTAGILLLIAGVIFAILQVWLYTGLLWAGTFGCLMAALNFRNFKNDGGQSTRHPRQTFLLAGTLASCGWPPFFKSPLGQHKKQNALPGYGNSSVHGRHSYWSGPAHEATAHWADCLPCLRQGRAVRIPLGPKASA